MFNSAELPFTVNQVLRGLNAMANADRLRLLAAIAAAGDDGLKVKALGEVATRSPASLDFHLHTLYRAGLTSRRPEGRCVFLSLNATGLVPVRAYLNRLDALQEVSRA